MLFFPGAVCRPTEIKAGWKLASVGSLRKIGSCKLIDGSAAFDFVVVVLRWVGRWGWGAAKMRETLYLAACDCSGFMGGDSVISGVLSYCFLRSQEHTKQVSAHNQEHAKQVSAHNQEHQKKLAEVHEFRGRLVAHEEALRECLALRGVSLEGGDRN